MNSCGGSDPAPTPDPTPEPVLSPEKALLVYPAKDTECLDAVDASDSEKKVVFDWQVAENTTSYKLYVKNLETDKVTSFDASTDRYEVIIESGVAYSWYVESISSKTTDKATSETWKFYLAGEAAENYAPFPADLTSPENGASVNTATISLQWAGSDIDHDIKDYDVFMDTNTDPTTNKGTVSDQKLENIAVTSGTTYYWKILTRDENGNTSTSDTFSFKVD